MDLLPTFVWKLKIYLLHTFWLEFFLCNLRWIKTIVDNNEGQLCLHWGGSWFWLFIVTQENFVLVYVFGKSRSITSFLSFRIHTISINTLITFFLLTDRQGSNTHKEKCSVFTSLGHCGLNKIHICNVTLGRADQTNSGVSFLRLGFLKKLVGVRFSQLHGTNICIGFVSPSLANQICVSFPSSLYCTVWRILTGWRYLTYISLSSITPKYGFVSQSQISGFHFHQHKLWPRFSFHRPYLSKYYCGSFHSASWHQHTYRVHFPWPSGPKHILTWVYFPSAWFIYNLLGLALLSFTEINTHTHTYIYIYIYIYAYIMQLGS